MQTIILLVVGLLQAAFGFFGVQLGISEQVSSAGVVGGLLLIAVWLFTTGLQDLRNFINGVVLTAKWSDPSFYAALIPALLLPFANLFGFSIPESGIGLISALLAVVIPFLISKFNKTEEIPATLKAKLATTPAWKLRR